jgi:signal transduction histidine kinase
MTQLVAELTELSRIETGKAELELAPVELNGFAEEAVTQLRPQVERQKVTLETELANDLPYIFERFYKADKSRAGQGSGIGLAIAKHVIESHGGKIQVLSEEGKGATFSINLPLTPEK